MNDEQLFCFTCNTMVDADCHHVAGAWIWNCKICGRQLDFECDDDDEYESAPHNPTA